jgi:type IV secretion system protein TrbI
MKEKNQEEPLKLRVKPVSSVRINKPLVLIISMILVFIFIWVIVNAFSTSTSTKKNAADKIAAQNLKSVINKEVEQLPHSYSDAKEIKKYLTDSSQPKGIVPPEIQQELTVLKSQQSYLQQKISELMRNNSQQNLRGNVQSLQAKTSGLFFPGVAPRQKGFERSITKSSTQTGSSSSDASSKSKPTSYDRQNMQGQKIQFMKSSDKPEDIYNPHGLVGLASPYEIQAGTLISAVLLTGINTSLPGEVVAQVQSDLFDTVTGRFLLIPKGSKFIGEYDSQIAYGQERVLIVFTRIIRPDGSSIQLDKYGAADLFGQAGMEGDVNSHWGRVLGAATLSTLLSVGAGVYSDKTFNTASDPNVTVYRSSTQNAAIGGAAGISQAGQQITERAINVQPTLTIQPGYVFDVIVKKDIILKPYNK